MPSSSQRADDADRDLAAVGDQDLLEHGARKRIRAQVHGADAAFSVTMPAGPTFGLACAVLRAASWPSPPLLVAAGRRRRRLQVRQRRAGHARCPRRSGRIGARFSARRADTMYVIDGDGPVVYDVSRPEAPQRLRAAAAALRERGRRRRADGVVIIPTTRRSAASGSSTSSTSPTRRCRRSLATPTGSTRRLEPSPTTARSNGHIANCIRGLSLAVDDRHRRRASRSTTWRPDNAAQLRDAVPAARARASPTTSTSTRRASPGSPAEDGTFGYDTTDPLNPGCASAPTSDRELRQRRPDLAGDGRTTPARLPAPQLASATSGAPATSWRSPRRTTRGPACDGQGSLQTWQITDEHNADGTQQAQAARHVDDRAQRARRPRPGARRPTVNCSAHWFDEQRGLLAQGWYDQGVRFLDISDPRDIRQVGYFVDARARSGPRTSRPTDPTRRPSTASTSPGGIDVLHIDRGASSAERTMPAQQVAGAVRPRRRGGRRGPLRRRPPVRPRLPAARGRQAAPAAVSRPQPSGSAFAVRTPRSSRATRQRADRVAGRRAAARGPGSPGARRGRRRRSCPSISPGARLRVQALRVAPLALLERRVDEHLDEVQAGRLVDRLARRCAVGGVRARRARRSRPCRRRRAGARRGRCGGRSRRGPRRRSRGCR